MSKILLAVLLAAAPCQAGKLDIDIYAAPGLPAEVERPRVERSARWTPGDPRDAEGEPRWVRYLSHAGLGGMAVGGLAASIATGGVAPAVGFGIVAAIHAFRAWKLRDATRRPPRR